MDDQIRDIELFKKSQDSRTGIVIEPYLVRIFFKIAQLSLVKYSKRADTRTVSSLYTCIVYDCVLCC